MNTIALTAAALLMIAPLPLMSQEAPRSGDSAERASQERVSESDFRERIAEGIETLERACDADVEAFCGSVTPGGGRLALCMRAHEDQLSRGCESALGRAVRNVGRTAERMAEACWNEVRSLCGGTDKVAPCVAQKKSSLSPTCGAIVTMLGHKVQALTAQVGMPVYSADDKTLGAVAEVVKGPDGKVQSIQVDIGHLLGIGSKIVAIDADKIEQLAGIRVRLSETELRSLPEAKKQ
jgi:PRC-barrel domain